jgi:hypothetical protein
MASRNFNSKQALEREIKDIYVKVAIGASGAPSFVAQSSYGSAAIVRDSAGRYTLTLSDAYNQLRNFKAKLMSATAQDLRMQVRTDAVKTKSVTFMCLTDAVETDPANGSTIVIKLELKNVAN